MSKAQNASDYLLHSMYGRMQLRRVKVAAPWCPDPDSVIQNLALNKLVQFGLCHADNTYDDGLPRYWLTQAGEEWFK